MPSSDNEDNAIPTTTTAPSTTPVRGNDNTGGRGIGRGGGRSGGRGSDRGNGRGGRANASRSNSNQIQSTNQINFEGDNPDVGAVLGLRVERFHKKATYTLFVERIYNYIISNYKNGHDLRPMFKRNINPTTNFDTKHKPPVLEAGADDIDKEIKKAEV